MTQKKALMLGAGGMAATWIRHMLPDFKERVTIAGLVDIESPSPPRVRRFPRTPGKRAVFRYEDSPSRRSRPTSALSSSRLPIT